MLRSISYKPRCNQGRSLQAPGSVRQASNAAPAAASPAEPLLSGTASVAHPFGRSLAAASRSAVRSARARVRICLRRRRASFKRPAARSRLVASHRRRPFGRSSAAGCGRLCAPPGCGPPLYTRRSSHPPEPTPARADTRLSRHPTRADTPPEPTLHPSRHPHTADMADRLGLSAVPPCLGCLGLS